MSACGAAPPVANPSTDKCHAGTWRGNFVIPGVFCPDLWFQAPRCVPPTCIFLSIGEFLRGRATVGWKTYSREIPNAIGQIGRQQHFRKVEYFPNSQNHSVKCSVVQSKVSMWRENQTALGCDRQLLLGVGSMPSSSLQPEAWRSLQFLYNPSMLKLFPALSAV